MSTTALVLSTATSLNCSFTVSGSGEEVVTRPRPDELEGERVDVVPYLLVC